MTPEQIEACAKLVGADLGGDLDAAGLIAVEDALLRRGWHPLPWEPNFGYSWEHPDPCKPPYDACRARFFRSNHDRATAAALAAMEEVR